MNYSLDRWGLAQRYGRYKKKGHHSLWSVQRKSQNLQRPVKSHLHLWVFAWIWLFEYGNYTQVKGSNCMFNSLLAKEITKESYQKEFTACKSNSDFNAFIWKWTEKYSIYLQRDWMSCHSGPLRTGASQIDQWVNISPWWSGNKAFCEGVQELTAGVDDTQVLPGARVTRISKVSCGGSNQAAFLSLAAGGEDLQSHRRLAVWGKNRMEGAHELLDRPDRWKAEDQLISQHKSGSVQLGDILAAL